MSRQSKYEDGYERLLSENSNDSETRGYGSNQPVDRASAFAPDLGSGPDSDSDPDLEAGLLRDPNPPRNRNRPSAASVVTLFTKIHSGNHQPHISSKALGFLSLRELVLHCQAIASDLDNEDKFNRLPIADIILTLRKHLTLQTHPELSFVQLEERLEKIRKDCEPAGNEMELEEFNYESFKPLAVLLIRELEEKCPTQLDAHRPQIRDQLHTHDVHNEVRKYVRQLQLSIACGLLNFILGMGLLVSTIIIAKNLDTTDLVVRLTFGVILTVFGLMASACLPCFSHMDDIKASFRFDFDKARAERTLQGEINTVSTDLTYNNDFTALKNLIARMPVFAEVIAPALYPLKYLRKLIEKLAVVSEEVNSPRLGA